MPTHLPQGRQTAIRNALIADPAAARRRTETMIRQEYRTSPHWSALQTALEPVGPRSTQDGPAAVAETSTPSCWASSAGQAAARPRQGRRR
nr:MULTISPECIES: hypothetical protein [Streptomyces]